MDDLKNKSQKELEELRWNSPIDSEIYKRANDLILQIQLDTNNTQTANLIREASKGSKGAEGHALWAIVISLLSIIITTFLQIQSNTLTQRALELSADPVIGISVNQLSIEKNTDEVVGATGFFSSENSILNLLLTNYSISTIEDVDMRMTLWQVYVNEDNRHLTICPLGYVDHTNNPIFAISNLQTDNVFNKTFSLVKNEEYPFTFDFKNLNNIKLEPQDSRILLRIGVNFTKSISQTSHNYEKLYVLNLFDGYVVDAGIAADFVLGLNDKKNEKEIGGLKFPTVVYPFREEEFLKYFEEPVRSLDLLPTACREFTLLKEQKVITY